jgi:transposase
MSRNYRVVRRVYDYSGMAQNFIGCDRDQSFLLPPDVRDWLPAGHLAWFVLDAVAGMNLGEFYAAYRSDGVGRRAYDPAMLVALLLYGYSRGVRSARAIERACVEDVAFKMIAMMETPDHATIARFVARHEAALAGLFGQVLRLCDEAGLVRPGVVAIDGTRMAGNASRESTRDFAEIAREILAEAKATDEAEDELYGEERGDELPEQLRTREGRAEFFRQARERRAAETPEDQPPELEPEPEPVSEEDGFEFDTERIVARTQGRKGWTREAHRQLEQRRWEQPDPVPRAREDRLLLAAERLEAERDAQIAANRAYEDYRQNGRDTQGRRLGRRPKPWVEPDVPEGVVSVSDPDTQRMKANVGYVQGYNAQAVVDEGQIVIAAEITNTPGDFSNLNPMVEAAIGELEQAGVTERPELALADAGYWNEQHMDEVIANKHIQVLIPPDSAGRAEPRPGWTGGRYSWMRTVLGSHGKLLYRRRIQMIEPVFAHTKHNRTITRFHRRGRRAVRTEWRLLMTTHNLTKLHRHQLTAAGA